MELSGKRIMLIGGAGLVGSHIVDQLVHEPVSEIVVFDNFIRGTKGNLKDTQALVREMRKANYNSVRGKFEFNVNHHPIQNFYLLKTVKTGNDIEMHIEKTIFTNHKDSYYKECGMKW